MDPPPVYLDFNATTPLAPEVSKQIKASLDAHWGNPSSSHELGLKAKEAIAKARKQVADMIGGAPREIIFTSGGTEANNMVLRGIVTYFQQFQQSSGNMKNNTPHVITSNVEHDSVSKVLHDMKEKGLILLTELEATRGGAVTVQDLEAAIQPSTCFVSIMYANNETGVIMPIHQISQTINYFNGKRDRKDEIRILFHSDAAQIIGKEKVNVQQLGVDYLTIVGHKFYGPRIGCLWARGIVYPLLHGGGQESNLRPGTENTPMIVGLGAAAELVTKNVVFYSSNFLTLRNLLENKLKEVFGNTVMINCESSDRLTNTCNVSVLCGLNGRVVLDKCKGLIAGVCAACHSENLYSEVLVRSGLSRQRALTAIRLSIGRGTTKDDILNAVFYLRNAVDVLTRN